MSSTSLSVADFLKLNDTLRVEAVDLAEVGRAGTVFVRELTEGERASLQRMGGKIQIKRGSTFMDAGAMPKNVGALTLKMGMVTDASGGKQFYAELKAQLGTDKAVMEHLEKLPAAVVNLLVGRIRKLSGLDLADEEDEDDAHAAHEEKKDSL